MFVKPRFVAVDDKAEHLSGIKMALQGLELDCHTKLYDVETSGEWTKLPGTRLLFLDKNLRPGVTMGGGVQDAFAAIGEVIQALIDPRSGPYGLIIWAEEPQLEELKEFLFERLAAIDTNLLPVFFAELRKADYIDTIKGDVHNAVQLREDIVSALSKSPQMNALFAWEADVMAASDAVLRSIVDLVPDENRASDGFGEEVGKILYRLSQAGAGIKKAETNPRESINRVLVPILADRITEHDPESGESPDWSEALVDPKVGSSLELQAKVNSAIHLSSIRAGATDSRPISPTDLGAVVEFPFENIDEALTNMFGIREKQLRGGIFLAKAGEWADCNLRLVQIGASCDHAQPKPGPLLYLLGIEWCFANIDGSASEDKPTMWLGDKDNFGRARPCRETEWQSPLLKFPQSTNPGKLSVFKNLSFSAPPLATKDWKSVYRLREELTNELTQQYARHIARPGIVTLP